MHFLKRDSNKKNALTFSVDILWNVHWLQQMTERANKKHTHTHSLTRKSNGLVFLCWLFFEMESVPNVDCQYVNWVKVVRHSTSSVHPFSTRHHATTLTPFPDFRFRWEHDDKIMYSEWCQCWCIHIRLAFCFVSLRFQMHYFVYYSFIPFINRLRWRWANVLAIQNAQFINWQSHSQVRWDTQKENLIFNYPMIT